MFFLWYILIGLVAGWLAGLIVRGSGAGCLVNVVVGVIGSVLGGWLFDKMGVELFGTFGSIISATVGAIMLLLIVGLFTRHSKHR